MAAIYSPYISIRHSFPAIRTHDLLTEPFIDNITGIFVVITGIDKTWIIDPRKI